MSLAEWRRLHAINLDGAFLGVRAGVRAMREAGGAIVNIGSIVGYLGARSGAGYGSGKAAIRGLTMQAAADSIAEGIPVRINAVHPGYIMTEAALAEELATHGGREATVAAFSTATRAAPSSSPTMSPAPLLFWPLTWCAPSMARSSWSMPGSRPGCRALAFKAGTDKADPHGRFSRQPCAGDAGQRLNRPRAEA